MDCRGRRGAHCGGLEGYCRFALTLAEGKVDVRSAARRECIAIGSTFQTRRCVPAPDARYAPCSCRLARGARARSRCRPPRLSRRGSRSNASSGSTSACTSSSTTGSTPASWCSSRATARSSSRVPTACATASRSCGWRRTRFSASTRCRRSSRRVAAMILHEEGRLKLDDPISKDLPAFDKPKVMKGGTVKAPVLVAAKTPITVKQLLTHTSGYIYGFGKDPIDTIYNDSKLPRRRRPWPYSSNAPRRLPLVQQPGSRSVRHQHGSARRDRREGVGTNTRCLHRVAHHGAARDEGDRLHRPRREARARGEGLHHRQGRPADGGEGPGARRHSVSRRTGSPLPVRRRRDVLDDWRLREVRADAAERGELDGVRILGPKDRGAHGGEPSRRPLARDARLERLRGIRTRRQRPRQPGARRHGSDRSGSSAGAARRRPTSRSIRRNS